MNRSFQVLLTIFGMLFSSAALSQSPSPLDFNQMLRQSEAGTKDFLYNDLIPYLSNTRPNLRADLENIRLEIIDSPCRAAPQVLRANSQVIYLPRHYIIALANSLLPNFWFLIDEVTVDQALEMNKAMRDGPQRLLRNNLKERCDDFLRSGSYSDIYVPASPIVFGLSTEEYLEQQARALQVPAARAIGDIFGSSIYFVLLHEIGHIINLSNQAEMNNLEIERSADAFAVSILNEIGMSVPTYIAAVEIYVWQEGLNSSDFNCRISNIVNLGLSPSEYTISGYPNIDAAKQASILPRMQRLYVAYQDEYATAKEDACKS